MLVKGKRIADLLPASATVEGARVLDCQGKLLLPGLIDVHWHDAGGDSADDGHDGRPGLTQWPPRKPSAR